MHIAERTNSVAAWRIDRAGIALPSLSHLVYTRSELVDCDHTYQEGVTEMSSEGNYLHGSSTKSQTCV
jgi:hypothetical protein